jgi:hypothetical protein
MHFETVVKMPSAWSGVHRHFAVHLFQDRVTVEQMEELDAIGSAWRRRHPGKLVELVVIFPSNNQMTSDERTRMTKLMKRWESERLASATVILAEGLVAAFQRSILTGLVMLVPPSHPAKIVGSIADAAAWLAPHLGVLWQRPVTHAELVNGISGFCAAFEARDVRGASPVDS